MPLNEIAMWEWSLALRVAVYGRQWMVPAGEGCWEIMDDALDTAGIPHG